MIRYKLLFWTALELMSLVLAIVAMVNHKMDWATYNAVMAVYFRLVAKDYDD